MKGDGGVVEAVARKSLKMKTASDNQCMDSIACFFREIKVVSLLKHVNCCSRLARRQRATALQQVAFHLINRKNTAIVVVAS